MRFVGKNYQLAPLAGNWRILRKALREGNLQTLKLSIGLPFRVKLDCGESVERMASSYLLKRHIT